MWFFFNNLITVCNLELEEVNKQCRQLGVRHLRYFQQGFDLAYWDSFSVCLVETAEILIDHSDQSASSDTFSHPLYSWQKFIPLVIDQMHTAYLAEMGD